MLGKLIKYDLKFGKNLFLGMSAILILSGFVFRLIYSEYEAAKEIAIAVLTMLIMIPAIVVTFVLIFQSFSRSVYHDQGYLTLTLPVKRGNTLLSKTIASMIWADIISLATLIMVCFMTDDNVFMEIINNVSSLSTGIFVAGIVCNTVLTFNCTILCCVLFMFLCATISNVSVVGRRLGGICAIIFGFAYISSAVAFSINVLSRHVSQIMLIQTLKSIRFQIVSPVETIVINNENAVIWNISAYAYLLVFSAITYFITLYLMKKKISLQ